MPSPQPQPRHVKPPKSILDAASDLFDPIDVDAFLELTSAATQAEINEFLARTAPQDADDTA